MNIFAYLLALVVVGFPDKLPEPTRFPAFVASVYDGDTVTAFVSLGQDTYKKVKIRLAHIDAPEMNTARGPAARKHLEKMVLNREVTVVAVKNEKFGRMLAEIFVDDECVNERMVSDGFAVQYEGGKRNKPNP